MSRALIGEYEHCRESCILHIQGPLKCYQSTELHGIISQRPISITYGCRPSEDKDCPTMHEIQWGYVEEIWCDVIKCAMCSKSKL